MQLFCLTYAGGTAAFYNQMDSYISDDIELVKLEYAGHGYRHKEPFSSDFNELADDLYHKIKEELHEEGAYALMGYSMGSISLVEILKRILNQHEIRKPAYVFLAAHEPVSMKGLSGFSDTEKNEWVKERTIRLGGVPETLLDNRSFWRMYLPIFTNDYSLIGEYHFEQLELKTQIPAVVFYSPTDTSADMMRLWKRYFTGRLVFYEYNGTHFFIQNHCPEMCSIINKAMHSEDVDNDI